MSHGLRRGGTGLLLLAVAAVLLTLLLTRGPERAPIRPVAPGTAVLGASVNRVFDDRNYTPAQELGLVRALAATGVDSARTDALWDAAEPQPAQPGRVRYDWSFDDEITATLAAAGLRWLPIVDYAPAWARAEPGLLHSPPAHPGEYAAFAGALARRYGPGGAFWTAHPNLPARPVELYEIWNEPDIAEFWSPAPNAAAYARLYALARAAIHAADPGARVFVGGLTAPERFLPAVVAADPALRRSLDGVAIHPYGDTTMSVLRSVGAARAALRDLGLGTLPLLATEFGWVTEPPGARHFIPAAARPPLIRQTVAALGHTDCGLVGQFLYTWVTPRRDPANLEDWYGVEPPGGGPSADARALADGVALARRAAPPEPVCG